MEPQWTQQESIDYECAVECIGDMISIRTAAIWQEEHSPQPDKARLAQLEAEVSQLWGERWDLSLHDHEHVARILREYGAEVRAERERTKAKEAGVPYSRYVRMVLETDLAQAGHAK